MPNLPIDWNTAQVQYTGGWKVHVQTVPHVTHERSELPTSSNGGGCGTKGFKFHYGCQSGTLTVDTWDDISWNREERKILSLADMKITPIVVLFLIEKLQRSATNSLHVRCKNTPNLPSRNLYTEIKCHGHHRHHDVCHGERYHKIICYNPGTRQREKSDML